MTSYEPVPICEGLSPWRTDGLMDSLILEAVAVAMAHRGTCVQHVTSGVSPEYMGSRFSEPGPSLAVGGGGWLDWS